MTQREHRIWNSHCETSGACEERGEAVFLRRTKISVFAITNNYLKISSSTLLRKCANSRYRFLREITYYSKRYSHNCSLLLDYWKSCLFYWTGIVLKPCQYMPLEEDKWLCLLNAKFILTINIYGWSLTTLFDIIYYICWGTYLFTF